MTEPAVNLLETTDAFVVVDLPHADTADGIVRCARKVLVDSTKALARSRTYAWALLGQRISGASAGINAVDDTRTAAIEGFCSEMAAQVSSASLSLSAGKGVERGELLALGEVPDDDPAAFSAGVIACAVAAWERASPGATGLASATVAVEFHGGAGDALTRSLESAGAEVVASGPDALDTAADVLLFGSKSGVVDHEVADRIEHRILVPTGALAFTPRALAVAARRDILVLPDFLTTAGPLAARVGTDPGETLAELTRRLLDHEAGAVLGACLVAEEFLDSWCDGLPFGRPIG